MLKPETSAAKLRNAISPAYSLANMLILYEKSADLEGSSLEKQAQLLKLIIYQAHTTEANKPLIDQLLTDIDNDK